MRKQVLITAIILLVLTACDYDVPLVAEASLPIDQALLGTWEAIPEDGDGQESLPRLVILKESTNQYEIEFAVGDDIIYLKGWLAELEGNHFVQVEVIGDETGPVDANYGKVFNIKFDRRFGVFSYTFDHGKLVVKSLNTKLINSGLADTAALQATFVANRDNPSLFHEPAQFKKL